MKTSYSRRELYAAGEPLGESATQKLHGRVVYGDGGGGGGPSSTTQTSDLPDWAKPYAKEVLGMGKQLGPAVYDESGKLVSGTPYEAYQGERQAQFTPMQQQAFQGARGMQPSATTGLGAATAALASERAMGLGYDSGQFQNQFQAPGAYAPSQFGAQQVGTQSFVQPGAAEAYMSPYMQNVVEKQQREAQRTADIAGTQRGAQAVGQGAFGGSRQAIMEAEAARNLAQQKGDIQTTGTQAAYQQAQQQFNAEQQARLQAQMANQQYGMTAQQAAEQSRQYGAGQGLTAAQSAAQYGQSARQLEEQSRQYGAGLGLQGLQTALTGAQQLGTLGAQQFGQGMDVNKLQQAYGTQQQQQVQSGLSQQYEDFLAQKKFPYQQLEFQSNLLRGTPSGSTSTMYAPPPSAISQVAGLGTAAYGASRMMAEGGVTRGYASGGLMDLAIADMMGDQA